MRNKIKNILSVNWLKTIRLNLHDLPFRKAIHLPMLVSRGVRLRNLRGEVSIEGGIRFGMVKMGFNTLGLVDWPRERMIFENSGNIIFQGSSNIGAACRLVVMNGGNLTLGNNVNITGRTSIICAKEVAIGSDSLLSWDIQVMDTDFHKIENMAGEVVNAPRAVKIGEHVWIGSRATILKGSEIPSNSVIAAGAVVSKKLTGEYVVFGGNSVNIIKAGITWKE